MSIQIKRSVGKVKCVVVGHHDISIDDEDKLYVKPARKINTRCTICGKAVEVQVNETDEDEYFVTEL